jgi:hypothetical protein
MARELIHVDISQNPELLQLVEQAQSSNQPVVLRREREDVAILRVVKRPGKHRGLRGRPTGASDPLWKLIGIGESEGPGDVSTNKHKYLADANANLHE